MKKFPGLATAVVGKTTWIGYIHWEDGPATGAESPAVLVCRAMIDEKYFPITVPETPTDFLWQGTIYDSGVPGIPYVVRPTTESDAIGSVPFTGFPAIPYPIPVMEYILSPEGFHVPNLYALSEDDGFVATMLLNSDAGLYVRASNAWHLLTDDDVVDGLNVTEVIDASLDMFDQFDRAGQLVHVTAMTPIGTEFVPLREAVDTPEPVLAALPTLDVPRLTGADDLPEAIQAAADNPELQWWVERRIKALGIEAELPWHVES